MPRSTILQSFFLPKRGTFYLSIFGLLLNHIVYAQTIESVYMDKFESGEIIYTITSRQYEQTNNGIHFLNSVVEDSSLLFLRVIFHKPDSLDFQVMQQNDFLSETSNISSDWLLFVHGDSKTFEQAVMRGFDIQHLHNINVIVYSWPTKDPDYNGIKNFKNSKKNMLKSLGHFTALMEFVVQFEESNNAFSDDKKLSMFMHSLGNSYIENMAKQNRFAISKEFAFDNLIINAAAVNQENHALWIEKLNLQKNLFITCNRKDFNLKGVHIFTKDGKQLGEVIELPIAKNANYIQFTEAVGFRSPTGTTHTYFIGKVADESSNIRLFYENLFHGKTIDFSDSTMFEKREDGIGYDIIF